MLLLTSQTVLFSRYHDIAQEYARKEPAAQASSSVKRLSALGADVFNGFAESWHLPANDPQVMAEICLFPKRMIL